MLQDFQSTISTDVIWMKLYMDSFLGPSRAPVRVTMNSLNVAPNGQMHRIFGVLCDCDASVKAYMLG